MLRDMETSENLTDQNIGGLLTSSQEGSLASLFQLPENNKGKTIAVISGQKCYELYGKYSRLGSLVKMFLESSNWHSKIFVLRWKVKAMKSSRLLFHLQASERGIKEKEFGSLPTITTQEIEHPEAELTPTGRRKSKNNNSHSMNVADIIRSIPTLTSSTATMQDIIQAQFHSSKKPKYSIISLPMITARDYRSPDINPESKRFMKGSELNTAIATLSARDYKDTPGMAYQVGTRNRRDRPGRQIGHDLGLKLHPNFAEVMQGYPIGWTE